MKQSAWKTEFEASLAGRGSVAELERWYAQMTSNGYAFSCSSGTMGLYFALRAAGVGVGDEVIVPAFDWFAAAAAVLHCGAVPRFANVGLRTYTVSPASVKLCATERTRAVIATHLFGHPCDMPALRRWCDSQGLILIEDGSHALGAICGGRVVGAWGDMACFSLGIGKPVSAGEGGMVVTSSDVLYDRLLALGAHPTRQVYSGVELNPFCLRAPLHPHGAKLALQNSVGFTARLQARQVALKEWNTRLAALELPIHLVHVQREATHAVYAYCPRVLHSHLREAVLEQLNRMGIAACAGSPAFYIPGALNRALNQGYWHDHPAVERLQQICRVKARNAKVLERTLITVDLALSTDEQVYTNSQ